MSSDLTARALIRNTALQLFAEYGPDAVSVRRIAEQAGVSPGLVLHHYGSKAGLREAVDAYAASVFDDFLDPEASDDTEGSGRHLVVEGDSRSFAEALAHRFPPDSPFPAYLRRLLLSGDPAGERLFRRWYETTLTFLRRLVDDGIARPSNDPEVVAAFVLVNDLALLLLRGHISTVLGTDPLTSDGMARWVDEVMAIYREGLWTTSGDVPGGADAAEAETKSGTREE